MNIYKIIGGKKYNNVVNHRYKLGDEIVSSAILDKNNCKYNNNVEEDVN